MSEKEKEVRKSFKTRCYYTDFVNQMFRFFMSTPESLQTQGKRKADVDNWIAVQSVWYKLPDSTKQVLTEVYKAHFKVHEGVRIYCEQTGTEPKKVWVLVTKTFASIARKRGLI